MKKFIACILAFTVVLPDACMARPVSYSGGIMPMTMNDRDTNSAMVLYSPTAKFSFGPFIEHYRDTDGELYGLQANYLAKRWNNPDSQANAYLLSGFGVTDDANGTGAGGYVGSEIDWEDRRFYLSYENRLTRADDARDEFRQKARLGIAPYVAEFGSVHTWLMIQADHMPEQIDNFSVTPLIRVFSGAYQGELGMNDDGKLLVNFVVTY